MQSNKLSQNHLQCLTFEEVAEVLRGRRDFEEGRGSMYGSLCATLSSSLSERTDRVQRRQK